MWTRKAGGSIRIFFRRSDRIRWGTGTEVRLHRRSVRTYGWKIRCARWTLRRATKRQVGNTVKALSGQYRFRTMGEYRALLSLYNMTVEEARGNVRGVSITGWSIPSPMMPGTRLATRSSPRFSGSPQAMKPCRRSLPVPNRRLIGTGNSPT